MKEKNSPTSSPVYFPHQKRTDRERTEKFYKDCIDFGINMAWWNENSYSNIRSSRKEKIVAYNLVNNSIDREEMDRVINPFRLKDVNFPVSYKNYPILLQNMNILLGEERKRFFNPIVNIINEDFVTEKLSYINDEFTKFVVTRLISDNINERQTEEELNEFNKWRLNYRERRERMLQQIVEYGFRAEGMKEKFSRGFEDLLTGAEEIAVVDIYGGEPTLRKGNPLNFFTLRSGESPYMEDADIIIEDGFVPIGEVIDRYHNELTSKQIAELESRYESTEGKTIKSLINVPEYLGETPFSPDIYDPEMDVNEIISVGRDLTYTFGGYFDREGNVRVTRVLWKGMRKVGFITYHDEDGNELKKIVPEQYKPIEGEEVKWEWITEWQEGTKIGYDCYVRMQPLPFQTRKLDNPSIVSPGIVGISHNINSNKAKSFISLGKEWQYLFNAFMSKLEMLFIKNKGKVGTLPLHLIPDDWSLDDILFYTEYLGWMPIDAFTEAREGTMTGKPGGQMQTPPSVLDQSFGNEIQQAFIMLDFIKRQVDDLTGISPQRKGAVDNRETFRGIERAVTQSSLTTEKWFGLHELFKIRSLKAYIQAAKYAWRGKSFKRNFVLDDGSMGVLDYDDSLIQDIEFGIDISTNAFDQQLMENLRSNVDRMLQNQTPLSVVIDLYRTKDPTVLQKKIKAFEEEQMRKAEQLEQQKAELEQKSIAQREQAERDKMDLEYEKLDREDVNKQLDREADIQKTIITSSGFAENKDINENLVPDVVEIGKQALEKSNQDFNKAMEKRKQEFEERKQKDDLKIEKEKLKLKGREVRVKEKAAGNSKAK